jgi:hypothetical protein
MIAGAMDKEVQVDKQTVTLEDFVARAEALFGTDRMNWRFVCPGCGHIASIREYKDAGAPEGAVGFSCIGRYLENCRDWLTGTGNGPCNYTAGGLLGIAPIELIGPDGKKSPCFALDESDAPAIYPLNLTQNQPPEGISNTVGQAEDSGK